MNWQSILNDIVYPSVTGLVILMIGTGLKILSDWLRVKAAQATTETMKSAISTFAGAAEQASSNAMKLSQEKWSGEKKKEQVKADAVKFAADSGFKVTEDQIDKMIEGVLGEQKLCK